MVDDVFHASELLAESCTVQRANCVLVGPAAPANLAAGPACLQKLLEQLMLVELQLSVPLRSSTI